MAAEEEALSEGAGPLRPTQGVQPMFHIFQFYLDQLLYKGKG